MKHVFDITVKELKNIPLLTKFIREAKAYEEATQTVSAESEDSSYIQNVAVKYSFPLDEDEILESDYIRRINQEEQEEKGATYDYSVSMNTVHTYLLSKEDPI